MMTSNAMSTLGIPLRDTVGEVDFGDGVSFEWLDGGRVLISHIQKPSRDAVNRYTDIYLKIVNEWDVAEPFAFITDNTHPEFSFTPFMRSRFTEISDLLNERSIRSYAVALVRKNLVGTMVLYFGNRLAPKSGKMDLKFLGTVNEALEWLREKLES